MSLPPRSPRVLRSPSLDSVSSLDFTLAEDEPEIARRGPDKAADSYGQTVPPSFSSHRAASGKIQTYSKHKHYSFSLDGIHFLVEGVLYSVHRFFFERDSSAFTGKGLTEEEPMPLDGVSAYAFEQFLSILYPADFNVYTAITVEDWTAILTLADMWAFKTIRALAIKKIAPIASAVDRIVLGRRFNMHEWMCDGYVAVCSRGSVLTMEEGRRLGVEDVVRIMGIRHDFDRGPPMSHNMVLAEVRERFALQRAVGHQAFDSAVPEEAPAAGCSREPEDNISISSRFSLTTLGSISTSSSARREKRSSPVPAVSETELYAASIRDEPAPRNGAYWVRSQCAGASTGSKNSSNPFFE
ncbi:hypothetical protein HWV62_5280 [Athelia sp. TMB]|nr:hypothetical protein HWV62_5280 [Athelia sp. TMB]